MTIGTKSVPNGWFRSNIL